MISAAIAVVEHLERRVLFAGGDLDFSFGNGGSVRDNLGGSTATPENARDVTVDSAGRVVVLGSIADGADYGSALRRYLPNGSVDTSFGGGDGKLLVHGDNTSAGLAVTIQPDGKIVVVGQYTDYGKSTPYVVHEFGVYRFNADGSVDTSFGGGDGIASAAFSDFSLAGAVRIQSDGKILVVGSTQEQKHDSGPNPPHWTDDGTGVSTNQIALARFNADGTLDNSFSGDGKLVHRVGPGGTYGTDLAIQPDGKVVVTGQAFTFVPTSSGRWVLLRFNADGSLDDGFGSGGVVEGAARAWPNGSSYFTVALDTQGQIVAGGEDVGAIVARHKPDGSLDTSFGTAGVARPPVDGEEGIIDIGLDDDGSIIAGGSNAITRLTANGTTDTTFGNGGTTVSIFGSSTRLAGLHVQSDNKIVAAYQTDNTPAADFLVARFHGGPGDNGPAPQPPVQIPDLSNNSWPEIIDLEADHEIFVTQTAANELIYMPRPKADGSVNIAGTEGGEQITVEPVLSLTGLEQPGINQRVYFSTSAGVIGVHLAYIVEPTLREPLFTGHDALLAQAKSNLAAVLAWGASQEQIARAQRNVDITEAGVARIEALKKTLAATTEYIRYRLDGVYEMYAAMSGQTGDNTRIRIDAKGGNDVVAISGGVGLKATIAGGWGADKLTSGRRRTLLMAGGGADRLISRSYIPSVLNGGNGADKFYTRFSACEVMARRGDGDCLVIGNAVIAVSQYGTWGISHAGSATPGKSYYIVVAEDGEKDLLA